MDGPGEYVADSTEGIARVEDLPPARIEQLSRNYGHRSCPYCGGDGPRCSSYERTLHDLGDLRSGRPVDLHVTYSAHQCKACRRCFNADMTDLALPKCKYTHRVQQTAVRLVVEDGLPYRTASWHLWRDHRVFVPLATLQNWVEAGGKKGGGPRRPRVPRSGPGRLLRLHRRR